MCSLRNIQTSARKASSTERRPITVSKLGNNVDVGVVLSLTRQHESAGEKVRRVRSEVHGDGVLVYFGYPQALKDDDGRA